jgi:hypothetical protein
VIRSGVPARRFLLNLTNVEANDQLHSRITPAIVRNDENECVKREREVHNEAKRAQSRLMMMMIRRGGGDDDQ